MEKGWRGNPPPSPGLPPPELAEHGSSTEFSASPRPRAGGTARRRRRELRGRRQRPLGLRPAHREAAAGPRWGTAASGAAAGAAERGRGAHSPPAARAPGRRFCPGAEAALAVGLRPALPHGGGRGAGLGPGSPREGSGRRVSPRRPTWLRPGAERCSAGGGRSGGRAGTGSAVARDRRARLLHQRSPPPRAPRLRSRPAHARPAAAPRGSCRFRSGGGTITIELNSI